MRMTGNKWLVLGLAVLAATAALAYLHGRGAKAAFAALPLEERNLAVYDAFGDRIEDNYFDPQHFKDPKWAAFRAQWREKAATAKDNSDLYTNVLSRFDLQFPDSPLFVNPPFVMKPATGKRPAVSPERSDEWIRLLIGGPGFDTARLHRPGGRIVLVVGDVVRGSPSDRAGIEPGWAILKVSSSSNNASGKVHFSGEFVRLTPEQSREYEKDARLSGISAEELGGSHVAANKVTLSFDHELLPSRAPYEAKKLDGGVSYVRFGSFDERAIVSKVVDVIDAAAPAGIIIDLRRNTGGDTRELKRVISHLLPGDSHFSTMLKAGRRIEQRTSDFGDPYTGPIAILIGPMSAGAAEILAAAMQDHKRGIVIGRPSSGSAMTREFFSLPDGGHVQVPVYDIVRISERRIEGLGVRPGIRVVPTLDDVRAGRDPVIERALAELRK